MPVLRKKCSLIRLTKLPPVNRLPEHPPPPPQSCSPRVSLTENQIVMALITRSRARCAAAAAAHRCAAAYSAVRDREGSCTRCNAFVLPARSACAL